MIARFHLPKNGQSNHKTISTKAKRAPAGVWKAERGADELICGDAR